MKLYKLLIHCGHKMLEDTHMQFGLLITLQGSLWVWAEPMKDNVT